MALPKNDGQQFLTLYREPDEFLNIYAGDLVIFKIEWHLLGAQHLTREKSCPNPIQISQSNG